MSNRVIIENATTTSGRSGEKNGKSWSFKVQWCRVEYETRDGEKIFRDTRIKLWNGERPYPVGNYTMVPNIWVDNYGDAKLTGFVLEPAEAKTEFLKQASG